MGERSQVPKKYIYVSDSIYIKFNNRQNENIMKEGVRKVVPCEVSDWEGYIRGIWDAGNALYLYLSDIYLDELTLWKLIKLYIYDKCTLSVHLFYSSIKRLTVSLILISKQNKNNAEFSSFQKAPLLSDFPSFLGKLPCNQTSMS